MNMLKFFGIKNTAPSEIEEAFYSLIAHELSSGQVRSGLWAKALADSEWNESRAKACYVKMRHAQLIAEINDGNIKIKENNSEGDRSIDEALEYGLSDEDIAYLVKPIKAIKYLKKYGKNERDVLDAISRKKLTAVMKNDILWLSDKVIS